MFEAESLWTAIRSARYCERNIRHMTEREQAVRISWRATRIFVVVLALLGLQFVSSSSASAQSNEASNHCGATNRTPDEATVPAANQYRLWGTYEDFPMYCGNGTTWGAVHIERKHNVEKWGVAGRCIRATIQFASSRVQQPNGAVAFTWQFRSPSYWAKAVVGDNGVITAYPYDSGSEPTWQWCDDSRPY
jgi:hypothetical protein